MKNKVNVKKISVVAVLSAMAFLCVFCLKFKVSFLTFDFKDAIISVIAFLYGPIFSAFSAIFVAFLEFISVSDTGVYGFIMNSLSSLTFALTCGLIYKYKRTFCGAIIAVVSAVIVVTLVMMVANIYVTPFYMGVSREEVINLISPLLLPFNLCKATMNAAVSMLIYKPITNAIRRLGLSDNKSTNITKLSVKTIISSVISIVIIIGIVLLLVLVLNGSFQFFK